MNNEDVDDGRALHMHHPHHHPPPHHRGNLQDIGMDGQMEDGGPGQGVGGMDEMDPYRQGNPQHDNGMMHARPPMDPYGYPQRVPMDSRGIQHVLPPADNVVTAQQVQQLPHGYTLHEHQQGRPPPHLPHVPMEMHQHHQAPTSWSDVQGVLPSPNGDQPSHHHGVPNSSPYIPQDQPPSPPDSDNSVNPVKETKKRKRQMKNPEQLSILEKEFAISPLPNKETRYRISSIIGLTPRQVQIWFQNKRAKVKNAARKRNPNFSFQNPTQYHQMLPQSPHQQMPPGQPQPQQQASPQHHQQQQMHHFQHAPPPGYPPQGYQFQHYQQPPYEPQHYQSHGYPAPAPPMPHLMDASGGGHPHQQHPHHQNMGSPQGDMSMGMGMPPNMQQAPPQHTEGRKKRTRRKSKQQQHEGVYDEAPAPFAGGRGDEEEEEGDEVGRVVEVEDSEREKYMQQRRREEEQHQQHLQQHQDGGMDNGDMLSKQDKPGRGARKGRNRRSKGSSSPKDEDGSDIVIAEEEEEENVHPGVGGDESAMHGAKDDSVAVRS